MTGRFLIRAALLVALALIGGEWPGFTRAQQPDASAEGDGLHVIVAVQGQVSVKRKGWSNYAPATFGTSLRRGDLLRLDSSSQAKVVCAGLTVHDAPSGRTGGVPCPSARPVLNYQGSSALSTRSYWSATFPVIVSPRKTKLLNPRPTLRWTPVQGATSYQIIVRGPELNWSAEVRSKTEMVYPDNAPAFKAENDYKLIVVANGRQSDLEEYPGLGFSTLRSDKAKEVRREEQRIRQLGLPDAPTRFLIAHLYATYGLNAEAIEQLEELSRTIKEPAAARLLGDLYSSIGLSRHAEERYLLALNLSEKANDEEGRGLAHKALGGIYEALGIKNQGVRHLKAALELSQKLGDQAMVGEIERLLAKWK